MEKFDESGKIRQEEEARNGRNIYENVTTFELVKRK